MTFNSHRKSQRHKTADVRNQHLMVIPTFTCWGGCYGNTERAVYWHTTLANLAVVVWFGGWQAVGS